MTPFGQKMRELRRERGVNQRDMARALGVSPAYLSALEHGHRGQPNWSFIQKVIGYFNVIWDDAEELENLAFSSHPRIVVDTSGLPAETTLLANRLAESVGRLTPEQSFQLLEALNAMLDDGSEEL